MKGTEYSSIQLNSKVKEQIVDYCNRKGYKIGRFIENIFLKAVSGSSTTNGTSLFE